MMTTGHDDNRTDGQRLRDRLLADRFAGRTVTLDGRAAIVGGRFERFAIVTTLDSLIGPRIRAEYAWPTVARVITDHGGKFRS